MQCQVNPQSLETSGLTSHAEAGVTSTVFGVLSRCLPEHHVGPLPLSSLAGQQQQGTGGQQQGKDRQQRQQLNASRYAGACFGCGTYGDMSRIEAAADAAGEAGNRTNRSTQ